MDTSQNMETRKYLENPGQSRHVFCFSFLERMTLWEGKLIWFSLFHIIHYFKCTVCYLCLVQFTDMIDVKWQHHLSSYYLIQMHWCWDVLKRNENEKKWWLHAALFKNWLCLPKKGLLCVHQYGLGSKDGLMLVCFGKVSCGDPVHQYSPGAEMAWWWFVLEKSSAMQL